MAFTLNANISGVFPVSNGAGPTAQGLAMSAQALNTIIKGINPDGTPAASVANQQPMPQAPPITRRPFTLASIGEAIKKNPLIPIVGVAAVILLWSKFK